MACFSTQKNDHQHTIFHQHFTTFLPSKNHVLTTWFSKNPQQKREFSRPKKITKYSTGEVKLRVICFSKIGKQKTLTVRRLSTTLRFHRDKQGVNLLKSRRIV